MKYKVLAGLLREELAKNTGRQGWKLPTEQELARRYSMSRQTVRHALRLLMEEGLIETRQGSGSYATGRTQASSSRQIAVVTSFLDDYIFPSILHDAQNVFSSQGCSTLVYATENHVSAEREILQGLLERPVSGILVEGSKTALPNPNADLYQRLHQAGVPMVFLHGAYGDLGAIPCISDDNYGGGRQLAQYLISKGHREIAGIFKSDDMQGPQRYYGAITAIRDAGLPIHDRAFRWYDTRDRQEILEKHDSRLLRRFLEERSATAVICYNDEIAFHLIRELLALGLRVPDDLAVVSFDNSYYSQICPVPITSLRHRSSRIGRVAAEELLGILSGEPGRSKSLEWDLVERKSG